MGLVHGVIDISDDESNDEVDMEEWSDDPEHAKLAETDRKLREQEQQDADVAKMYQEMYDKNDGPREEEDCEVAMMYQKLYDQNATTASEAEIANATANRNLAQEVELAGRETSPVEGGRRDVQVDENANESCHRWQANIGGRAYIGDSSRAGNMSSMKRWWRRKGKKSKRGSKRKPRVRFSNVVETIFPSESSESEDGSSDHSNTSSEDDAGSNEEGLDTLVANDVMS